MNATEHCAKYLNFVACEQKEAITSRKNILIALERAFGHGSSWFLLSGAPQPCTPHNLDSHMVNDYITCYCRLQPFAKTSAQNGDVLLSSDLSDLFEESEFYRDFLARYGYYYMAMVPMFSPGGASLGSIAIFRTYRQGDFTKDDREALSWVGQYVAVAMHRQIESNRGRDYGILLEASLQNIQLGYLLLDENYNTLFFNAAARDYAGNLAAQHKAQSRNPIEALKEIVFSKLNVLQGLPPKPWNFSMGQYHLNGYPIFPYTSAVNVALKRYVICISKTESTQMSETRQLLTQFGLTNREREVVRLLQQGYNNHRIASELCISENTAKVHLRNIYAKMEVCSRAEVLAMLSSYGERTRMAGPSIGASVS